MDISRFIFIGNDLEFLERLLEAIKVHVEFEIINSELYISTEPVDII